MRIHENLTLEMGNINFIEIRKIAMVNLLNMLFGCFSEGLPERQVVDNTKETCPDVIEKTGSNRYESDIEVLKARYRDDFKTGLCIETTLQEMLVICPRERKRSDAYKGLVGYLKRNYGITLVIHSNKNK